MRGRGQRQRQAPAGHMPNPDAALARESPMFRYVDGPVSTKVSPMFATTQPQQEQTQAGARPKTGTGTLPGMATVQQTAPVGMNAHRPQQHPLEQSPPLPQMRQSAQPPATHSGQKRHHHHHRNHEQQHKKQQQQQQQQHHHPSAADYQSLLYYEIESEDHADLHVRERWTREVLTHLETMSSGETVALIVLPCLLFVLACCVDSLMLPASVSTRNVFGRDCTSDPEILLQGPAAGGAASLGVSMEIACARSEIGDNLESVLIAVYSSHPTNFFRLTSQPSYTGTGNFSSSTSSTSSSSSSDADSGLVVNVEALGYLQRDLGARPDVLAHSHQKQQEWTPFETHLLLALAFDKPGRTVSYPTMLVNLTFSKPQQTKSNDDGSSDGDSWHLQRKQIDALLFEASQESSANFLFETVLRCILLFVTLVLLINVHWSIVVWQRQEVRRRAQRQTEEAELQEEADQREFMLRQHDVSTRDAALTSAQAEKIALTSGMAVGTLGSITSSPGTGKSSSSSSSSNSKSNSRGNASSNVTPSAFASTGILDVASLDNSNAAEIGEIVASSKTAGSRRRPTSASVGIYAHPSTSALSTASGGRTSQPHPSVFVLPEQLYSCLLLWSLFFWQNPLSVVVDVWGFGVPNTWQFAADLMHLVAQQVLWLAFFLVLDGLRYDSPQEVRRRDRAVPTPQLNYGRGTAHSAANSASSLMMGGGGGAGVGNNSGSGLGLGSDGFSVMPHHAASVPDKWREDVPRNHPNSAYWCDFVGGKLLLVSGVVFLSVAACVAKYPALMMHHSLLRLFNVDLHHKHGESNATVISDSTGLYILYAVMSGVVLLITVVWCGILIHSAAFTGDRLRQQRFMSSRYRQMAFRIVFDQFFFCLAYLCIFTGLLLYRIITILRTESRTLRLTTAEQLYDTPAALQSTPGWLLVVSGMCYVVVVIFTPPRELDSSSIHEFVGVEDDLDILAAKARRQRRQNGLKPLTLAAELRERHGKRFCVETACHLMEAAWQSYYIPATEASRGSAVSSTASSPSPLSAAAATEAGSTSTNAATTAAAAAAPAAPTTQNLKSHDDRQAARMQQLPHHHHHHKQQQQQRSQRGRRRSKGSSAVDAYRQEQLQKDLSRDLLENLGVVESQPAQMDLTGLRLGLCALIHDPEWDIWGFLGRAEDRLVLCFRGSVSANNVMTDVKLHQVTLTREMLHRGTTIRLAHEQALSELGSERPESASTTASSHMQPAPLQQRQYQYYQKQSFDDTRPQWGDPQQSDDGLDEEDPVDASIDDNDEEHGDALGDDGTIGIGDEEQQRRRRYRRQRLPRAGASSRSVGGGSAGGGDREDDDNVDEFDTVVARGRNITHPLPRPGHGHGQREEWGDAVNQWCWKCMETGLTCIPGARQTLPRVHSGFWEAYESVREQVIQALYAELESGALPIYVTGHSLGGALAVLAGLDVAVNMRLRGAPVTVYTFGSPRVGNEQFRRFFKARVPHCFRVAVDGDLVTQIPSFLGVYTHVGRTVILDNEANGNILVEPTFVESTLLSRGSASFSYHTLSIYRSCLESCFEPQERQEYYEREFASHQRRVGGLSRPSSAREELPDWVTALSTRR